jgi:translation initiation factor IF-2
MSQTGYFSVFCLKHWNLKHLLEIENWQFKIILMTSKTNLITRPPVVVVMGHVDHGKTSILDYIRKTHIADRESGGITQHIGASVAEFKGKTITFIDTPGHEAFSQMRARGAKIADIAVLVVAAEEGCKPQTKEAAAAIKKAGLPVIVAMNKADLPQANIDKVKRDLEKEDLLVEDWGGNVPAISVSAKTGQGIDELLEMILLVAEMENFQADLSAPAAGIVIESSLDHRRGPSAAILLQDGVLNCGQIIGTASTFGKIKSLEDFCGKKTNRVEPSFPAVAIGFESVPITGEPFRAFNTVQEAHDFIKSAAANPAEISAAANPAETAENQESRKIFKIIVKADVLGTLEVLRETIGQIPATGDVSIEIIGGGAGEINLNDVKMAKGGNTTIVGFRVKINPDAKAMAEREKIRVMNFDVIYEMIEWLRLYMEKIKTPQISRKDLGKLKVLLSFWADKNRQIVGGKIISGEVKKGVKIEVFRNEESIGQGRLINLQKNKKDIAAAGKGDEVGILYEGREKIQEGDQLVFYIHEKNL